MSTADCRDIEHCTRNEGRSQPEPDAAASGTRVPGGRLGAEACAFIDSLVDPLKSSDLEVRRNIYRKLSRELARQQCYMLTNLASELQRPDAAASGSG